MSDPYGPLVSVLLVANEYPPTPAKQIGSFFSQTAAARDFEVILVDCQDRPDFRQALQDSQQRHPDGPAFTYEAVPGKGRAHTSNVGLRRARGDTVLFFAGDFIAPPDLVAAHMAFHRDHPERTAVGIGAGLLAKPADPEFCRWHEASGGLFGAAMSADMKSVPLNFFYVGNSSVKKAFIEECGPFDESFPFFCWDDYEMGLRMAERGMQARYIPEAVAEHDDFVTLQKRCGDIWKLGYSARIHEVKYPQHPRTWSDRLRRPALAWQWRVWRKRVKHALTRNPAHLKGYYKAMLQRSFVQGYARARAEYR